MTAKRERGRPTKYDPAYCAKVVEYGAKGMGRAEIAAKLDVARLTLANWEAEHPEFLAAMTRARDVSAAWWAEQGRTGIWSRDFNANAYRLQVLNRFPDDWRDKSQHEVSGANGAPLAVEVVRRVVAVPKNRLAQFTSTNGQNGHGAHGKP